MESCGYGRQHFRLEAKQRRALLLLLEICIRGDRVVASVARIRIRSVRRRIAVSRLLHYLL